LGVYPSPPNAAIQEQMNFTQFIHAQPKIGYKKGPMASTIGPNRNLQPTEQTV
jgi:hypothetical protein